MCYFGWVFLGVIGLAVIPQGWAGSWEDKDVHEVPCFDYPPAPANELELIKTHGEGWWYYLQGNRAHARISALVLTGKVPASEPLTHACGKISRHATGFKQHGFGGMAEFKCEGEEKRVCKADPDSKNTTKEWACQRGTTEATIVWTHANKYAIGLRCSGKGDKTTTVWSLRSTEAKDPPEDVKALVKEVIKKHGFKVENLVEYPQAGCAPAGRSIVPTAGEAEDKQGAGYAEDKKSAQGGRSIAAPAPISWDEADVKELPCSDFASAPESDLAVIKTHGEGWWYYVMGNRAHARISSIVLTGKQPGSNIMTNACTKISRHAGGFKQTGFGGMAEFKCEGEVTGKRVCRPDPDSKNTTAEWACQRGPTEAVIVWTHANKYAIGIRCSGQGDKTTAVWSLRSTEAKDPPEDVKALAKEVIKKHGFKEENIIEYPQAGCAPAGRSIVAEAEDKQGAGYGADDKNSGSAQGGRSITPQGPWAEAAVKEVPCSDFGPGSESGLALLKSHGEGWWYYLQGNKAHARIFSIILTGNPPASDSFASACHRLSRHAGGFKQTGLGGTVEFKCEGELHGGKRVCGPDPESKNMTKEAIQRGPTEASIVWTHGNKYAIGLRCAGLAESATAVWHLRSTEAKDPPEDVKALVKEFIKKHGFKEENIIDYPQAGCAPAPAGRSIAASAGEAEDKQGGGYGEDKKSAQGGRSIAAPAPISWAEADVKELPCSDFASAPESDLAVIKTHGEGWWYYVLGNRAHARISSIVLTGKQPESNSMVNACTKISRHAGGFKQTGFGGMAEFKCEGEVTGKRVCRPDPDSKNTTAEWACQRGPTEAVIVWTHANKYAIGIRCSGQGDKTTAVWSLRSTEPKDPPEDIKALVKEVIKKHGFKEENMIEYPQAGCAPAGRSIAAAAGDEDKQGAGYGGEDKKSAQGGRSITPQGPWAEAAVIESPCSDFVPAPDSDLALIKSHGEGWWYYIQGNRAHARISSIVLTGHPPASESLTNACNRISRHAGGFKQIGFGGMAEFKCEGEVSGKRVCSPDPESKNTTKEWASQRGPTEATIVWTHANKYAIGLRCSGLGESMNAVWSLRSTEPKDPPEDVKALVKEVIKKHGFKVENLVEYPQAGCAPAPAGRSIAASAAEAEDKQGGGYAAAGSDTKQGGRSIGGTGAKAGDEDKQGSGYAA